MGADGSLTIAPAPETGPRRRSNRPKRYQKHGPTSSRGLCRRSGGAPYPPGRPPSARALHEWRVSLTDDRGSRGAMAAQDGARKHGGRVDAYVFCLISDWRGVRRLLVVPSGPSHQVALGLRLDFVPAPPRG